MVSWLGNNLISKYRLHSNAFERPEEDNPHDPKNLIILSVEGANTERQYFEHLSKHIERGGSTVFCIEVLRRKQDDGHSSPEYVIELLNEYIDVLNNDPLPEPWMERFANKYSFEVYMR
jgi:hypothetical protein